MNNKLYRHFEKPETLIVGTKAHLPNKVKEWEELLQHPTMTSDEKWEEHWKLMFPAREVGLLKIDSDRLTFVDADNNNYEIDKSTLFQYQYIMCEYST